MLQRFVLRKKYFFLLYINHILLAFLMKNTEPWNNILISMDITQTHKIVLNISISILKKINLEISILQFYRLIINYSYFFLCKVPIKGRFVVKTNFSYFFNLHILLYFHDYYNGSYILLDSHEVDRFSRRKKFLLNNCQSIEIW
jgi:hypothetical protein